MLSAERKVVPLIEVEEKRSQLYRRRRELDLETIPLFEGVPINIIITQRDPDDPTAKRMVIFESHNVIEDFGQSLIGREVSCIYANQEDLTIVGDDIKKRGFFAGALKNVRLDNGEKFDSFLVSIPVDDYVNMGFSVNNTRLKQQKEEGKFYSEMIAKMATYENQNLWRAGALHDILNFLNPIKGLAYLGLQGINADPEKTRNRFQAISENVEAIEKNIRRVTTKSENKKSDGGNQKRLFLTDCLNRVVKAQRVAARLNTDSRLSFNVFLDYDLWPVSCDEDLIENALHNLIRNACNAMAGKLMGEIRVTVKNIDWTNRGGGNAMDESFYEIPPVVLGRLCAVKYVMVEVEDDGMGISRDMQEKLFKPYATSRSEQGGTGLGLFNVKTTVEKQGGVVGYKTEAGVGTRFYIFLPAMVV